MKISLQRQGPRKGVFKVATVMVASALLMSAVACSSTKTESDPTKSSDAAGSSDVTTTESDAPDTSETTTTESDATDTAAMTTLRVGALAKTMLLLPFEIAKNKGFFEQEKLEIETVMSPGGAGLTPALIGGSTDIAGGVPVIVFPAIVAGSSIVTLGPYERLDQIVAVPEDSPIASVKDLVGKKVGVSQRGALGEKTTTTLLTEAGVDPKQVDFVSVGDITSTLAALRNGTIDAASFGSDTMVLFGAQGLPVRQLGSSDGELYQRAIHSFYTTTTAFAEEKPDVVNAFCRAMGGAVDWISDPANADELGSFVSGYLEVSSEDGKKLGETQRDFWKMDIDEASWEYTVNWTLGDSQKVPFASSVLSNCG